MNISKWEYIYKYNYDFFPKCEYCVKAFLMPFHGLFFNYKSNKCTLWKFVWLLFLPFKLFYDDLCYLNKVESVSMKMVIFGTKGAQRCIYAAWASAVCLPEGIHFRIFFFFFLAFDLPEFLVIHLGLYNPKLVFSFKPPLELLTNMICVCACGWRTLLVN